MGCEMQGWHDMSMLCEKHKEQSARMTAWSSSHASAGEWLAMANNVPLVKGPGRSGMKVYIACAYAHKREARLFAAMMQESYQHESAGSWLQTTEAEAPLEDGVRSVFLKANIIDLTLSQVLIVLGQYGNPRATFGEAAWAISNGTPVLWVHGSGGEGRCLWDSHDGVKRFIATGSWEGRVFDALDVIEM